MKNPRYRVPLLSLLSGFVGAAMFQFLIVGVSVEAEKSPNQVLDSIAVKQLTLYNHKNEVVAKLSTDSYGLPIFQMGRNEFSRIELNFVTENQPAITVLGGLGKSFSVMSVRNHGAFWEPMLTLGHRDQSEGVMMSIFNNAGNLILTNKQGETLKFDATQGGAWRRVAFNPAPRFASPSQRSISPTGKARYSNTIAR